MTQSQTSPSLSGSNFIWNNDCRSVNCTRDRERSRDALDSAAARASMPGVQGNMILSNPLSYFLHYFLFILKPSNNAKIFTCLERDQFGFESKIVEIRVCPWSVHGGWPNSLPHILHQVLTVQQEVDTSFNKWAWEETLLSLLLWRYLQ